MREIDPVITYWQGYWVLRLRGSQIIVEGDDEIYAFQSQ